ncbi:MAG: T9SS type A sorting domain-containing protein [Bacteroidota bacterium]
MKRSLLTTLIVGLLLSTYGQNVDITFNLNMNLQSVDPGGVYLAGGSGFGSPGDNELTDPDGDGIYSITITKPENFSSHYTFLNGNCGDYSCKENIGGQACADPGNFNDRFIQLSTNDTVVNTCFGICTTDTICSGIDSVAITFNLDMSGLTVDPGGVYLAGGGSFGNPGDNEMLDPDGDSIYTITLRKPVNFASFYTFTNGNCPDFTCKEDITGQACADPNNFNDRFFQVSDNDTIICTAFAQCVDATPCNFASNVEPLIDHNLFKVQPNQVYGFTSLIFTNPSVGMREIEIIDISGRVVMQSQLVGSTLNHKLELPNLAPGLYFVKVSQEDKLGIKKIQVMH